MAAAASGTQVLVTGASGFIAGHVIKALQQSGFKVRGTVRDKNNPKKCGPLQSLCPNAEHPLELFEADLLKPEGWLEAVSGCEYVLHVASPFPSAEPKNENELIKPAVDGTLAVLQACQKAGGVKRVVLTSSVASVSGGFEGGDKTYTEEDWTNVETCKMAYVKSKTLAEKAAWDFIGNLKEDEKFELSTINPSYVMGPVLSGTFTTSMEVIKRLMNKEMPMLPKLNFSIVDVRDVAEAHVAAMTVPEAANCRHIVASHNVWIQDMAKILEAEFKPQGYSIPTTVAPYAFLWIYGIFDKTLKMILPSIGKVTMYTDERMKNVLGVSPKSVQETIVDMAYSMVDNGMIKKTSNYKGVAQAEEAKDE